MYWFISVHNFSSKIPNFGLFLNWITEHCLPEYYQVKHIKEFSTKSTTKSNCMHEPPHASKGSLMRLEEPGQSRAKAIQAYCVTNDVTSRMHRCTCGDFGSKLCDLSSFSFNVELLIERWKQLASMLLDFTAELNLQKSMIFLGAFHYERNI